MEYEPINPPEPEPVNTGLKIAVLIGLIVLLVIGILLPIKLVPNAFSTFGTNVSDFFNSHKRIVLSVDKSEIDSSIPFTLSWTGAARTNGTYILSYTCANGVHLETSINQPNEPINCGGQYYFTSSDNSIVLTPYSTVTSEAPITLSLSFLENGSTAPQSVGSLDITITNPNSTGTPTPAPTAATTTPAVPLVKKPVTPTPAPVSKPAPQTPKPAVYSSHRASNPYGLPDLAVVNMTVGTQYVYPGMRGVVHFTIINNGSKNSGPFSFTATLPGSSHPVYTAYNQQNLGPGDYIVYTLSFDIVNAAASNIVTVTVDPTHSIPDLNLSNNSRSATLNVSYSPTQPQPYNYNQY